jgi:LysR family transcriptional regulator (chromosome initiation inhibitor)
MNIDSDKVQAFSFLAKLLNFSKAAKELHITQPALSKKVAKLEEDLGVTLFTRSKRRVELTEAGYELVNYWQSKAELDRAVLSKIGKSHSEISGSLRFAGFSTITNSVILPTVAPLLKAYPSIKLELYSKECSELPSLLLNGLVDFIFTDEKIERENVVCESIGKEELIHVRPLSGKKELPYLDHDPQDVVTLKFLKSQGEKGEISRHFMDDIHSILSGVELGVGQAIISSHLLRPKMKVIAHSKRIFSPVYVCYMRRMYTPLLHREALNVVREKLSQHLLSN